MGLGGPKRALEERMRVAGSRADGSLDSPPNRTWEETESQPSLQSPPVSIFTNDRFVEAATEEGPSGTPAREQVTAHSSATYFVKVPHGAAPPTPTTRVGVQNRVRSCLANALQL